MHVITKEEIDQPFLAPLGELIYELIGSTPETGGATKHSLAHVVVPQGKLSPRHYHKVFEETYYILKGQARMQIDGQEFTLSPGQSCLILPGEVHQVFNDRPEDLEFLVICAPPWTPDDFFEV
ncbi:MAG: cupin domain-containing protein [Anaerolineae bacterium]|nr:cupin domain-containing protein [Anaerolineae bacterium]